MSINHRYAGQTPTHPDCPTTTHTSARAYRKGCLCAASREAYDEAKERDRVATAARRAAGDWVIDARLDGSVTAPDFYSPDVPGATHQAGALERALYARHDLACRRVDPELFFPIGGGPLAKAQEVAARRVCLRSCPAVDDCLTVSLQRDDDWSVMGGTTAAERRRIRSMLSRVAA